MTKTIFTLIAIVLFFDCASLLMWKISGQEPVDGMHAGAITENIIKVVAR